MNLRVLVPVALAVAVYIVFCAHDIFTRDKTKTNNLHGTRLRDMPEWSRRREKTAHKADAELIATILHEMSGLCD